MWSPALKASSRIGSIGSAFQSRSVFTRVRPPADDRRVVGGGLHPLGRVPDEALVGAVRRRGTRPSRRSRCRRPPRAGRTPRGCRARARSPAARPASRRRSPGGRGRGGSGCRSRRPARPTVAMLSMKQAASRPRPPLPSAASASSSAISSKSTSSSFSAARIGSAEPEVRDRVAHQPADQELEAEVVDPLLALEVGRAGGVHPVLDGAVAGDQDHRLQPVVRLGDLGVLADAIGQPVDDLARRGSPGRRNGDSGREAIGGRAVILRSLLAAAMFTSDRGTRRHRRSAGTRRALLPKRPFGPITYRDLAGPIKGLRRGRPAGIRRHRAQGHLTTIIEAIQKHADVRPARITPRPPRRRRAPPTIRAARRGRLRPRPASRRRNARPPGPRPARRARWRDSAG